jgi:hypothetical protein
LETGRQLFTDFKKAYDSFRREVLYNILIEFGVQMKLVWMIKICLNKTQVQDNQVGLKLNKTHQLLVYADDVNLLGDNMDTIKKNTHTFIDASKEVGLEVITEKTKYMLLSHHQNAGQNYGIKRANRCFENVA